MMAWASFKESCICDLPSAVHLALDLLNGANPVLDVIGRRELVAPHREQVDGHRLEALAGSPSAEKFAHRSSGRLATQDDPIAGDHDVFDAPGQVGNARADLFEDVSELL